MDTEMLVGMRVMNTNTHAVGTIEYIRDEIIAVGFYGTISKYSYPAAFAGLLELEDEELQEEIQGESVDMTCEQWALLEALLARLEEMEPSTDSLAYEIACNGRR